MQVQTTSGNTINYDFFYKMENDKKRTRSVYENDMGSDYIDQGYQYAVPPSTPINRTSSTTGSIFNFGNGVRDNSGYQFRNSYGDYTGKDGLGDDDGVQYRDWREGDGFETTDWGNEGSADWGNEGEDWEWTCTECGKEVTGNCECSEVCDNCNQEWDSCYCKEGEGYDSVG